MKRGWMAALLVAESSYAVSLQHCGSAWSVALERSPRHPPIQTLLDAQTISQSISHSYVSLLTAPPFELQYSEYYDFDKQALLDPIVGIALTPSGYALIAIALANTLWAPWGLIGYIRQTRQRGEYIPKGLDWIPDYVPPMKAPGDAEEAQGTQREPRPPR